MASGSGGGDGPRCEYVVPRKRRACRMLAASGKRFCAEHSTDPDRIPCPNDPKHNCAASKLDRHLKVCPSRPRLADHAVLDVNLPSPISDLLLPPGAEGSGRIGELGDAELLQLTRKIETFQGEEPVEESVLVHPVVEAAILGGSDLGPGKLKHLRQNSSLMGNMDASGLLKNRQVYVEFGCGRGQLTYWLAKAFLPSESAAFVLVDRASHRHKMDNKLKDEEEEMSVCRVRCDIKDLVLSRVLPPHKQGGVVGVGKHLCGPATDLALQCMVNFQKGGGKLEGIAIALCCHHRCQWQSFVGKRFLVNRFRLGSEMEFRLLTGFTSWATCGSGRPQSGDDAKQESSAVRYKRLGLDTDRREAIGRKAKRIIDLARLDFVRDALGARCVVGLKIYVDRGVSPENMLLVAKMGP